MNTEYDGGVLGCRKAHWEMRRRCCETLRATAERTADAESAEGLAQMKGSKHRCFRLVEDAALS